MTQQKITCTFMRAGTSRGPFLDLRDLPQNVRERDDILLKIMGSPDIKQIDGLGGATFVTSKVVMLKPSERKGIDVDYLFAQVIIDQPIVDTKPTCGNMMSGVAPFAIEKGWVKAKQPQTRVMVYNLNTNSTIETIVQTPHGQVNYVEGDCAIDGVRGTAAPILMNMFNVAGGATGHLFPTGCRKETINAVEVSIVDAGNLMILLKATDLNLTGLEDQHFFENNKKCMEQLEAIRQEAGRRIGLGDVSQSVLPKIGVLSTPKKGGAIKSQYFTPKSLHPTHAVSGAVCIAAACKATGTVAADIASVNTSASETIEIEHPSGRIPIQIEVAVENDDFTLVRAGTLRTARKIMEGDVYF